MIQYSTLTPSVYTSVKDCGIMLTIRYMTSARAERSETEQSHLGGYPEGVRQHTTISTSPTRRSAATTTSPKAKRAPEPRGPHSPEPKKPPHKPRAPPSLKSKERPMSVSGEYIEFVTDLLSAAGRYRGQAYVRRGRDIFRRPIFRYPRK